MIVPWRIVPTGIVCLASELMLMLGDVGSENRGLSRGRRWAPERNEKARKLNVPFLSSMVTVSLAHFIKKLNDQSVKSY